MSSARAADDPSAVRQLLDKVAVTEVLHRYCHALDRGDRELADTVWHRDGTADYRSGAREDASSPAFRGKAVDFLDRVFEAHSAFEGTSHQVTNILIEVDGDAALSRTYVTAALWTPDDVVTVRARYLDTWSRRDGGWRIDHRVMEHDLRTRGARNPGRVSAAHH